MKFDRIIKSVLFIFAASLILCGCPALEDFETGTLTFTITGDVADAIQAASAQSSYRSVITSNLFFNISLKGEYEAEKTIAATAGSTATFDMIPVNKRIHAEASAYEQNSDGTRTVLYTGTSDTIVIQKGNNTLALAMQATGNSSGGGTGGSGTGGSGSGTGGGGTTPTSYTITYNLDGGSNASTNVTSYTSANLPLTLANPTKASVYFGGWYTTPDFQATTKVTQITTAGNYTLYAKWVTVSVGDILMTDGSFIASAQVTSENVNSIVGIVYALDTNGVPSGVVGIKNSGETNLRWAETSNSFGKTVNITDPTMISSYSGSGSVYESAEQYDTDGSDNWACLCGLDPTGTSNAATNYPAFNWANNYVAEHATNLSGTSYATGWYMPTLAELFKVYLGEPKITTSINAINNISPNAATPIAIDPTYPYYAFNSSSVTDSQNRKYALGINFAPDGNHPIVSLITKISSGYVCCGHKIITN